MLTPEQVTDQRLRQYALTYLLSNMEDDDVANLLEVQPDDDELPEDGWDKLQAQLRDIIKKMTTKNKRAIVEVEGGVAQVMHEEDGVECIIIDHDDLQERDLDFDPIADPKALELYLLDDNDEYEELRIYLGKEVEETN